MVFITHASTRSEAVRATGWRRFAGRCRAWRLLGRALLGLGVLAAAPAHADGFTISDASTHKYHQVYELNAHIEYRFTEEVLSALDNGVPITLLLEFEVKRKRRWWINETVATLEQRYQLSYHAFSDQFVVRNLNSGALYTYPSLSMAVSALGAVDSLPLLDAKFIHPNEQYEVEMRTSLDIEALPAPLRPIAYITPAWRLSSDWYTCSLTP